MKHFLTLIFTFTLFLAPSFSSSHAAEAGTVEASPATKSQQTALVHVNGLVCDFCARALEKVFGKQEAVQDINVDLDRKLVTLHFKDGQKMSDADITKLITDSGYNVESIDHE